MISRHELLSSVLKPGRYTGGEWNSIVKDHAKVDLDFALAFPDVYEVGMSYLGFKILYHILNRRPDVAAERTYAPWVDMEMKLREQQQPLTALESGRALREFDVVGFTLQYEMSYTNIINMLDLSGISKLSCERGEDEPFVIAGGPVAYNPEPLADFLDFVIIGEGEEVIGEVCDVLIAWKTAGKPGGRRELLHRMVQVSGIYVPSFYTVEYDEHGQIRQFTPNTADAPPLVQKRIIQDLDSIDYPTAPVVPYVEAVHDRIMIELFRGCSRGCRFCHAGMIYRPVRERSPQKVIELARQLMDNTGYDEISLTSLSSNDYSCLHDVVRKLTDICKPQGTAISLPSLRIDSFSVQLAQEVAGVRKTGLTFAPEAGTQRLRDVINKGVSGEDIEAAMRAAFAAGWSGVKLYFMIGLPTETDEDLQGIADLAYQTLRLYQQVTGKRDCRVSVSVSSFVPKPNTPFQWEGQISMEQMERKQQFLAHILRDRRIQFKWHDARLSSLEGVFARGDRRLSKLLLRAWELGCKFDSWDEHFHYDRWLQAIAETGTDASFYAQRRRDQHEIFPWQHLGPGVSKQYLWSEYQQALNQAVTPDCRQGKCSSCGVCPGLGVEIVTRGDSDVV